MLISASRRTDIPAFYSEWLMNRLRDGYCMVPNPFRPAQVSRVSLRVEDVDAIVFWTRNARPLLPHLDEMDDAGYRYYFLYTLVGLPREMDPGSPPASVAVDTVRRLADRLGPERVVWRYDPIVVSQATGVDYHLEQFERLATQLQGATGRAVISFVDRYRKTEPRLRELAGTVHEVMDPPERDVERLARGLASLAPAHGMAITSCAEELDLRPHGIPPGPCIDLSLLQHAFGLELSYKKDPGQRKVCGCARSRDIGTYDTCLHGCRYCYATSSFERARGRHDGHDPTAHSLMS